VTKGLIVKAIVAPYYLMIEKSVFYLIVGWRTFLGLFGLKGLIILHKRDCQQYCLTLTYKPMAFSSQLLMAEDFKSFE
jgi:hypothetical protein